MTFLLAYVLFVIPHFDRGPGTVLNIIAFHPIIIEGEVLAVDPQVTTARTQLTVRADGYLHGSGPDTARIELGWINTRELVTEVNGRILQVPAVGDRAIFWIGRQARDLNPIPQLSSESQIWEVEGDSLRALGWSLEEGRRIIREAIQGADPRSQLSLASAAVVGQGVGRPTSCAGLQDKEGCWQLRVEEWVKGSRADTLITIIVPSPSMKVWYHRGLLLLAEPDSLGRFRPVDPVWSYYPMVDDQCVVGFRLERNEPLDRMVPILVGAHDLLGK